MHGLARTLGSPRNYPFRLDFTLFVFRENRCCIKGVAVGKNGDSPTCGHVVLYFRKIVEEGSDTSRSSFLAHVTKNNANHAGQYALKPCHKQWCGDACFFV